MNENIFFLITAKIKEGELENLKSLMKEMSDSTKAGEPETMNYEWFISGDEKFCHLYERYSNSDLAIKHLGIFGKNYAKRFMEILDVKSSTAYGNPTDELKNLLTTFGIVNMTSFGGFTK